MSHSLIVKFLRDVTPFFLTYLYNISYFTMTTKADNNFFLKEKHIFFVAVFSDIFSDPAIASPKHKISKSLIENIKSVYFSLGI